MRKVHFTVTGETRLELTMFDTTLQVYYANHVVLMLHYKYYFLGIVSMRKGQRFLSKQGQPTSRSLKSLR